MGYFNGYATPFPLSQKPLPSSQKIMAQNLITLTTYTYNTEAFVLVAKLEAEGIKSFLKNEHLLSTQQFLSNAVGGLEVQVAEEDLEKARAILKSMELEKTAAEELPAGLTKGYAKVLVYCPECESSHVYRKKGSFFSLGAKEHVCADCHHKWKQ